MHWNQFIETSLVFSLLSVIGDNQKNHITLWNYHWKHLTKKTRSLFLFQSQDMFLWNTTLCNVHANVPYRKLLIKRGFLLQSFQYNMPAHIRVLEAASLQVYVRGTTLRPEFFKLLSNNDRFDSQILCLKVFLVELNAESRIGRRKRFSCTFCQRHVT